MSMFKKLFGSSKNETAPPKGATAPPARPTPTGGAPPSTGGPGAGTRQVIQQMDDTLESMELREQLLMKKIDAETTRAKDALAKKNKNLAILCMKRKKMYEQNLEKLMAQRGNMETVKITMEDTTMTLQVLQAQRAATSQLVTMNQQMGAEQVEDDIDKLRDAIDEQARIADLLQQDVNPNVVDEDELMDELKEMMAADKKQAKVAAAPAPATKLPEMPAVPSGDIAAAPKPKVATKTMTKEEEEEAEMIRQLESELNAA